MLYKAIEFLLDLALTFFIFKTDRDVQLIQSFCEVFQILLRLESFCLKMVGSYGICKIISVKFWKYQFCYFDIVTSRLKIVILSVYLKIHKIIKIKKKKPNRVFWYKKKKICNKNNASVIKKAK